MVKIEEKEKIPTVKETKKEKLLIDGSYFDELKMLKKLSIELIDKTMEFLFHAKRMLKRQ